MRKNFDALQIFLSSLHYNFDIIGITETWLKNNSPINMYNIDNYSLVQVCRSDRTGGEVALYVKNSIDYILRSDLSFWSLEMEVISIEIKESSMKSKIIGCVYIIDPLILKYHVLFSNQVCYTSTYRITFQCIA